MIFRVIASACWFRLKCLQSIDLIVRLEVVKSSIEFDKFRLAVSVKAIFANGLHHPRLNCSLFMKCGYGAFHWQLPPWAAPECIVYY